MIGNLPKVRVVAKYPFEVTVVDYCGPFFIKEKRLRNRNKIKVYVAIFICISTKVIHIELISYLTTELFIEGLRRFFARRRKSKAIYLDNGSNFVGANNKLTELYDLLNSTNHN